MSDYIPKSTYIPTEDEVETAFHEFASELEFNFPGKYPEAPEFAYGREALYGFRRWLARERAEARREAVVEFAKQHGIGDLESRPLYDAQTYIADLESEVEHLRTVERRLEAQVINAEAEALREAAEAFSKELGSNAANPGPKYVVGWLHNRAAKLEGK